MGDFRDLVTICRDRRVFIQTHNFPDPDAISSAFGLQKLLGYFDIESTLCYAGRIDLLNTTKMLRLFGIQIYSYEQLEAEMTEEDAIICVDSQKSGGNIRDFIGNEIASIDHHPTYVPVEYEYSDLRITGACATIIASYYHDLKVKPDSDIATALSYGIRMDTLQLSRGVTQLDIDMFAYLYPFCDQDKLTQLERNHIELKDLRAYGCAIDKMQVFGNVAFTSIPFSCPDALVAIISDFLLSLEEITLAVVLCHREGEIKFSVRSEDPNIHAGQLIHDALDGIGNGGGHKEMAGGTIRFDSEEDKYKMTDELIQNRFLNMLCK